MLEYQDRTEAKRPTSFHVLGSYVKHGTKWTEHLTFIWLCFLTADEMKTEPMESISSRVGAPWMQLSILWKRPQGTAWPHLPYEHTVSRGHSWSRKWTLPDSPITPLQSVENASAVYKLFTLMISFSSSPNRVRHTPCNIIIPYDVLFLI